MLTVFVCVQANGFRIGPTSHGVFQDLCYNTEIIRKRESVKGICDNIGKCLTWSLWVLTETAVFTNVVRKQP